MAGGGGAQLQLQLQRQLLPLLPRLRHRLQRLARIPWLPVSSMLRFPLEVLVSLGAPKTLSGDFFCLLILECERGLVALNIACFADDSRFGTSSV